jgi:hypothetical protein
MTSEQYVREWKGKFQEVTITDGGFDALLMQLVNKAMSGDMKSAPRSHSVDRKTSEARAVSQRSGVCGQL